MNLELWFPQPIWYKHYDVDFSSTVSYIQKLKTVSPGRQVSNFGGWQSNPVDLENVEELKDVFKVVVDGVQNVAEALREYGFEDFRLSNAWINVNKGTDFNREHVHPDATFSGCLYLKASDAAGAIEFMRPDNMKLYPGVHNKTGAFFQTVRYQPAVGKLLIFPAWLSHMVLPSNSDEERISIAFNIISVEQ